MGKVIDLIGQKFGRLFVEEYLGASRWLCKCECGNYASVLGRNLRKGLTMSCGCLIREIMSERGRKAGSSRLIDLTGKRFGKLEVLKRVDQPEHLNSKIGTYWLCRCDCGNEAVITSMDLRRKDGKAQRSCGCSGLESSIAIELKQYCTETYSAIPEYREFKNPETGRYLPYDIYIPSYEIFIEVNGSQHYSAWSGSLENRETLEYRQHKDAMKQEYAEQHGTYIEIDLRKIKTTQEAIEYVESFIN